MGAGGITVMALCVVVVIAIAIWASIQDRKRRDRLREFCLSQGWSYVAADQSLVGHWRGVPFDEGNRRKARNAIRGTHGGHALTAFDYSYETESTNSKGETQTTTHEFAIVSLALPAYLPTLTVVPANLLTRIIESVGLSHISLESEDFNRHFLVRSHDAKFASDVLHPRLMEKLLAQKALHWRISGTDIICWEDGKIDTVAILERASVLALVVDSVPSFVWHDHGVNQGHAPDQPDLLGGNSS